jgi:hypothetical protein
MGYVLFEEAELAAQLEMESLTWRGYLIIMLVLVALLFLIKKYRITSDQIIIHHPGWNKSFNIKDLTDVEKVPEAAKKGIGLFGIWGIGSFSGIAKNRRYGIHTVYINNSKNAVALKFGSKTVILSPNHPSDFIHLLQEKLNERSE